MIRPFFPYLEMVSFCFTMVLIAVRLQISHLSDLVSVGRASAVALSHSFDISLSLSVPQPHPQFVRFLPTPFNSDPRLRQRNIFKYLPRKQVVTTKLDKCLRHVTIICVAASCWPESRCTCPVSLGAVLPVTTPQGKSRNICLKH